MHQPTHPPLPFGTVWNSVPKLQGSHNKSPVTIGLSSGSWLHHQVFTSTYFLHTFSYIPVSVDTRVRVLRFWKIRAADFPSKRRTV